ASGPSRPRKCPRAGPGREWRGLQSSYGYRSWWPPGLSLHLDAARLRRFAPGDGHAQDAIAVARLYPGRIGIVRQADDTLERSRKAFVGVNGRFAVLGRHAGRTFA